MRGVSIAVAVTAVLGGCSASKFAHQECKETAQCQKAFGFGSVCGADGLCDVARATPRCNTSFPDDLLTRPEGYKQAIVIGSLMDRSSVAHQVREKAVRLAVKELADDGGIDGRPVAAVFCDIAVKSEYDNQTRPGAAVANATYLAADLGVPAIVGPSASGDAQAVWDAMRTRGTVVISPAATSPALLGLETTSTDSQPGFLWRVAPPDSLQGAVIADDMMGRGVKSVAVIRQSDPYGEGLAQIFQQRFTAAGGTTVIHSVGADTQIGEASAMVAASAVNEVLFISSQQDWVIKFLNAASGQSGFQNKGIFLTDAAANQTVLTMSAAAMSLFDRVRGTRPAPRKMSDYVYASFVANYKAQYRGEDPATATYSDHSYDGAWLALAGAAWSHLREGGVTGLGIARGLRKVSAGARTETIPSAWRGLINAFRGGSSINLSGASGELDFDASTRSVASPIEIWKINVTGGQPSIAQVTTVNPG